MTYSLFFLFFKYQDLFLLLLWVIVSSDSSNILALICSSVFSWRQEEFSVEIFLCEIPSTVGLPWPPQTPRSIIYTHRDYWLPSISFPVLRSGDPPGSEFGQLLSSPHLFPFCQVSLSWVVQCPLSENHCCLYFT